MTRAALNQRTETIVDGTGLTRTPAKAEAVAMTTLTLASKQSGAFIQLVRIQLISKNTKGNFIVVKQSNMHGRRRFLRLCNLLSFYRPN